MLLQLACIFTALLLYLPYAISVNDDHHYRDFSPEQHRDERDQFSGADNTHVSAQIEVSTEHLQRYWGMSGQSLAPMSHDTSMSQTDSGQAYQDQQRQQHRQQQQQASPALQYQYQNQQQQPQQQQQPPPILQQNHLQQPHQQQTPPPLRQEQQQQEQQQQTQQQQMGHMGGYSAHPQNFNNEKNLQPLTQPDRYSTSHTVFFANNLEQQSIDQLRLYISNSGSYSTWLHSASDTELLRFIRAREGDLDAAWLMIWNHSLWRQSPLGPESFTSSDEPTFQNSFLNQELYWSGVAYDGSPVLCFRTGLHQSGAVDAEFYTRFLIWLLEKGKREFGVGVNRQLYVIIDRTPASQNSQSRFGSSSPTTNLPVMKAVFSAVQDNYPEILKKAFIVPANTITRMLFLGASTLMNERSREKISLIKSDDFSWWHELFPGNVLPESLGGFNYIGPSRQYNTENIRM